MGSRRETGYCPRCYEVKIEESEKASSPGSQTRDTSGTEGRQLDNHQLSQILYSYVLHRWY